MTPFPWHDFELTTRLTPQEARAALAAHIEPEKLFRFAWPNKANDTRFAGRLDETRFSIHRILGYRNSFAPASEGVIAPEGRGARITIKMRLHPFVIAFVVMWLGIMLSVFGAAAITPDSGIFFGLPILLTFFVYLMTMLGFWLEAGKQEQTLREIFQAG